LHPVIIDSARGIKNDERTLVMHKVLSTIIAGIGLVVASSVLLRTGQVAAQTQQSAAVFDAQGRLKLPDPAIFRRWVFVGAPLTPNALNKGKAAFPEYHHVYIEGKNVDAYLKTGSFPEGTVIVKELTRLLNPTFPDGSREEPSGRGYFNGQYNGIDVTVKDSKKFTKSNGWGFFTFGHHPEPYAQSAAESPIDQCAFCHQDNVARTDMTWIQFYPLLRDKKGY
jgi:Cytochrome P460